MKPAKSQTTPHYSYKVINMDSSAARPSDRFIPYYFVAFFVGLVALTSWFVYLAIHNYPGEVTTDAYKKGLNYNQYIERAGEQEKLGWRSDVKVASHGQDVDIQFNLKDKSGKPIDKAAVEVLFVRPTHAGRDQEISLKGDGKGNYFGKTSLAWAGEWQLGFSATYDGHNYQKRELIILK